MLQRHTFTAGAFSVALLLAGCSAGNEPDKSPLTDQVIHQYLVSHADVLDEMVAIREKKLAAPTVAKLAEPGLRKALTSRALGTIVGNPAASVTVVEFFDFACPYCKSEADRLDELLSKDSDVRVIYKPFPILATRMKKPDGTPFSPTSLFAAKAGLVAAQAGKYRAFHDALIRDKSAEGKLTLERILDIGASVGLDKETLRLDAESPDIDAKLKAVESQADQLGFTGTPSIIVLGPKASAEDSVYQKAISYDELARAVAAARRGSATPKE